MSSSKKTVLQAAAVVTLLSISERAFGFLYRIILSRCLGAEAMGLYYIALSVFGVLVTVAASGIPVSVSRLMIKFRAEGEEENRHGVISAGVCCALCYALFTSLLLALFQDFLSPLFTDSRSKTLLLYMLPGLTFTAVYAALRGSFWGNGYFTAYAVIELIEEIVMVAVGTLFVTLAASPLQGAKFAAVAVTLSYFVSFTLAFAFFFYKGGRLSSPKGTLKPLLSAALPVTGMRTVNSLLSSAVAVLFPAALMKTGLTSAQAVSAYATVGAMAMPILFAPSSIIGSVSLVLVPKLSGEFYDKRKNGINRTANGAICFAVLLACFLVPLFAAAGKPLCLFLYDNLAAGQMVEQYAVMLFPMTLSMMTTSILNSMGMEKQTLGVFLASGTLTLGAVVVLPPLLGADALLVGYAASFLCSAACNLLLLRKKTVLQASVLAFSLRCAASMLPALFVGKAVARVTKGLPALLCFCFICLATLFFQVVVFFAASGKILLKAKRKRTCKL